MTDLKNELFKVVTGFHEAIFKATQGRLGGRVAGMPVLILHTTGRKSGQRRSTMLTTPVKDEDRIVIVASKGGDPKHPTWFLNLEANPDVEVTIDGGTKPMKARTATKAEKDELWPQITGTYKGYAGYQQRTDRDIPVVILEPR
ncbi:MAG: hypothetical protein QOG03_618 [Actinomycetota bacterium]|jgi:deazaflavin-dependent oxidoreductase (nitroreductase family)|nr:hypothetical protein [Actinomycetota bacterium]